MEQTIRQLEQIILSSQDGPRSMTTRVKTALIERGMVLEAAQVVFDTCAMNCRSVVTLNKLAVGLTIKISRLADIEVESSTTAFKMGIDILNWFAQLRLTTVERQNIIIKNKVKPHWIMKATSKDFKEYAKSLKADKHRPPMHNGPIPWTGVSLMGDDWGVDIVKKARRDKMLHHYRHSNMPLVYDALNRLNRQTFEINEETLALLDVETEENTFIPVRVTQDEKEYAYWGLNDVTRKALEKEEVQFLKTADWDGEGLQPNRELAKNIRKYIDIGSVKYKEIIKKNSARVDYEEVHKLAKAWVGKPLNFIYTCDTRGRIYAEQPYLNPLASDLAKALLLFTEATPISAYDLCLHIANSCGVDKLAFDDRVQWVNDNADDLLAIGSDPWGNYSLIQKLKIDQQKNLWQALAALKEYVKYTDYVVENGTEDGFTSRLPIGLDSTSSGTQLLTMLTKDDVVAPYVNLTRSPNGLVGDFYTYLADHCHDIILNAEVKRIQEHGLSDTLQWFTKEDVWAEVKRNVAKRNSMTFNYSGTEYGFGTQHLEDKSGYGKRTDEQGNKLPSLGDKLEPQDCFVLGSAMYETCRRHIKGSAKMMDYLRDGVAEVKDGIVSWKLPDGFTAYQCCRKVKSHKGVAGMVGNTKVTLRVEFYSDEGDSYLHANGIAANWTHSYDSWMLREIVRNMPEGAPITTVHDMFLTSSYYVADLQEVARAAYKTVANREVAAEVCADAFGIYRELPSVGDWTTDQLDEAEFFIC